MDEERLRAELEQWIEENLTEVERPRALTLGRNMPVNAIGKVSDW
jgi:acyl-coenzyme A synthetase/AMP-(fatty) acid ligase